MAHIKRKYIDKHWLVFCIRGGAAFIFGLFLLGGRLNDLPFSAVSIFLLTMGIIDSSSALYSSLKKRGWITSIIDAAIDIIAALCIIFLSNGSFLLNFIVIASYTFASGIIDIVHSFFSTVDPTDRFIRIVVGICGCIMGFVILNAGEFEMSIFLRIFGAYMLVVGVCSLIYGVHNHSQSVEDTIARKESAKIAAKTRLTKSAKITKKN